MKLAFSKMTGAGNDFVVIDNRRGKVDDGARLAQLLCDRRWGIGADGLLLLEKSKRAAYRMLYFNADGSYGGMCGNGGRCIALYAFERKIAPRKHAFEALDFVYAAQVGKASVQLGMKDPNGMDLSRKIRIGMKSLKVAFVDTGSPHAVVDVRRSLGKSASLSDIDVIGLGRKIRYDSAFQPTGTNVNFIERIGRNSIAMRTYERGVEDETLACGTGSIASALVSVKLWDMDSPVSVLARSGRTLVVTFVKRASGFANIQLAGPAATLFKGKVEVHV